jgi:hypothetical protein
MLPPSALFTVDSFPLDAIKVNKLTIKWIWTFFTFSLIIDGATEKVLQFMITLKSVYNKKSF